ncbi:hypothetical protein CLF_106941, partial [Clonorchis sinensis]
ILDVPLSEQQQLQTNNDSFIKPELSDSASETEMSNSPEHPLAGHDRILRKKGLTSLSYKANSWQLDRISWQSTRLLSEAKALPIFRAFDVHQSSRFFLELFTIWRLRSLCVPSYALPTGVNFLASVMENDLDDIQWSSRRRKEIAELVQIVELWWFFESGGLVCFLLTFEGPKGNEPSCVPALWRDQNQLVSHRRYDSIQLRLSTDGRWSRDPTGSTVDLQLVASRLRDANVYAESSYWPGTVHDQNTTGGDALRCRCDDHRLRIGRQDVIPRNSADRLWYLYGLASCKTATNATPHERMFHHNRKSAVGTSLPQWLLSPGPVLMRRNTRSSKFEPVVEEVELLECNPEYAYVRHSNGTEETVSLRHLAPSADFGCAPASEQQQLQPNTDSFIKPEPSDSASETEMSNPSEHPLVVQQQRTRPYVLRNREA